VQSVPEKTSVIHIQLVEKERPDFIRSTVTLPVSGKVREIAEEVVDRLWDALTESKLIDTTVPLKTPLEITSVTYTVSVPHAMFTGMNSMT